MQALVEVILPVFLVIAFGYGVVRVGLFGEAGINALMKFTMSFAIPCLLFSSIATLDLRQSFDAVMMGSYYTGAMAAFLAGLFGARVLFGRPWEDAVVIGFVCLFSNGLLLGVAITERAYGSGALAGNFAIVSVHAPFAYLLGITVMEIVRSRGGGIWRTGAEVAKTMLRNPLMIGIGLGFVVNLTGLPVPTVLDDALQLMVQAAIPTALFGLGGILCGYRPEGDLRLVAFICAVALVLHPGIVMLLGVTGGLSEAPLRSAVVMAAMAPGLNGYLFASMYGRAMRVAASSILLGTVVSILTAWLWLQALP